MGVLMATSLVAKLAYSYDVGGWTFFEGTPRMHCERRRTQRLSPCTSGQA